MLKRKVVRFLVLLVILLVVYLFRYPIFLQFQYLRLQSLQCKGVNCFQRIWAHRVNSVERYNILKNKFGGFELDVIYTGPKTGFAVMHPPDETGGDTLLLDTYFSQADMQNDRFWLDTRFLDSSNMQEGLIKLNELAAKYPVRQQCILEVYYLPVAQLLAEKGYIVSFNVSERWLRDLPNNKVLLDSVTRSLQRVNYVSQDAAYLSTIKKLFPGKKILTWHLAINDFFNRKPLKELLADPQVEIVLVNIKTRYSR
jgi:hypothetical protein